MRAPKKTTRVERTAVYRQESPPVAERSQGLPRPVEASIALAGCVVLSPLLALAALATVATSAGPVLFRQTRVGESGRHFDFLKLRTMRLRSTGPKVTALGDSRITPVGRVLRRLKIDEIPSLWNVVRGDLSLVGPRPEVPDYVDLEDEMWRRTLSTRPGLTDPSTIALRHEETVLAGAPQALENFYRDHLLPWKLRTSADYLARRTPWSDFAVLFRTAFAILRPAADPGQVIDTIMAEPSGAERQ